MANQKYPKGVEGIMDGDIDLLGDDIVLLALSSAGTYNSAHDTISDLSGVIAKSAPLGSKSVTDGKFKGTAASPTWSSVGTNISYLVLAQDTGNNSTSRLIEHRDADSGLPVTQDGGNVTYTVHADGFFTL